MANPHKGEIAFSLDGKEYTFRLGTYALVIIERRTKIPAPLFISRPQEQWGAEDMLALVYAGLYQHHKLPEEEVAEIIDDLGSERLATLILDAMAASGLSSKEGANGSENPPQARAIGTGIASSSNGSRSD